MIGRGWSLANKDLSFRPNFLLLDSNGLISPNCSETIMADPADCALQCVAVMNFDSSSYMSAFKAGAMSGTSGLGVSQLVSLTSIESLLPVRAGGEWRPAIDRVAPAGFRLS